MKKQYRNYSPSFKQKAVELSYARGNTKQVSEELEIPYSVLHRWRKESQDYGKNSFPDRGKPKLTDEQKERFCPLDLQSGYLEEFFRLK